ncbi:MAG: PEGA domain-containing protein [Ignavibacteriae bacterium]|nr:PEGA domain-containing protein [Ignavibacteriota bacterium]
MSYIVVYGSLHVNNANDTTQNTATSKATLTVQSNIVGTQVYADSVLLGFTPLDTVQLESGVHVFRFLHPDGRSWLHSAIVETLTLYFSQHLHHRVTFPNVYHISSEPYGATVFVEDSVIGQTPLRLPLTSMADTLRVTKDGFREELLQITPAMNQIHVPLTSLHGGPLLSTSPYLSAKTSNNNLPLFITTGTTVLAGATAAYFKIKADKYYNDYRTFGDQHHLQKVREYDRISGISLAATELSFLLLTYLLLSR